MDFLRGPKKKAKYHISKTHEKMFSRIQNILVDKLFILYFLLLQ